MVERRDRSYVIEAVAKRDFDRDPLGYMRQSGPERQILVEDDAGKVHFAFGGELDVGSHCDDE